jgi:hypothetical protein
MWHKPYYPAFSRTTIGILGALFFIIPSVGLLSESGMITPTYSRFQILEGSKGEAVLDIETQLIWERSPNSGEAAWANASLRCALTSTGGRLGWRLPSFFELMTLVEPSLAGKASLPAGHPFRGVRAGLYWTSSSQDTDPTNAYAVDFLRGDLKSQRKNQAHTWWCVRGRTSNAPAASSSSRSQESI